MVAKQKYILSQIDTLVIMGKFADSKAAYFDERGRWILDLYPLLVF